MPVQRTKLCTSFCLVFAAQLRIPPRPAVRHSQDRRDFTASLQTLGRAPLLLIILMMWFWLFLDGTDFFTSGRSHFQSVCETVLEHTNESHPALCSAHSQNWILAFFLPANHLILYASSQHFIPVSGTETAVQSCVSTIVSVKPLAGS